MTLWLRSRVTAAFGSRTRSVAVLPALIVFGASASAIERELDLLAAGLAADRP